MIAKETVYKKVKKIVTEILNLELDDIRDEKIDKVSLEEYGYNSIDALEVLVALEEEFQIQINDENLNFYSPLHPLQTTFLISCSNQKTRRKLQ